MTLTRVVGVGALGEAGTATVRLSAAQSVRQKVRVVRFMIRFRLIWVRAVPIPALQGRFRRGRRASKLCAECCVNKVLYLFIGFAFTSGIDKPAGDLWDEAPMGHALPTINTGRQQLIFALRMQELVEFAN